MATITLNGNPVHTTGNLPEKGQTAPGFTLVKSDMNDLTLQELQGKRVILSIFPSLDTDVCAVSVRKFNEKAAGLANTVVLAISKDPPSAMGRFCSAEGIDRVITLSAFRNPSFGKEYGVEITDGPFAGLLARSVLVLDEEGKVIHSQLVPEIAQEPDYEAALSVL
ncbi:MAG TPA: thiol peroxidase [Bacteroidetes bacterium]|nr:thiol peroxidase [Bacteroidota bacterium]